VANAGTAVPIPPAVLVRNAQGQPMAGVTVQFTVSEGGGSVTGGSPTTDASGVARVGGWTLGPGGTQRLAAQAGSLAPVTFQATLTPGTETITTTIGTGGGTVQVQAPGHPLQGLVLTIPAGTFTAPGAVSIRVATNATPPIVPAGYRISGPILEVHAAMGYGSRLMTLEVPVTRGANEDVVLAMHDPARGVTEVLPTIARGPGSITIATSHLRADLLSGPTGPGLSGLSTGGGLFPNFPTFPVGQSGWVMQVVFSLPQPPSPQVFNAATHQWPVQDHGSAAHPDGFGPAVPALIKQALAIGAPGFANRFQALETPGFYAESAPLLTAQEALLKLSTRLTPILQEYQTAVASLPKATRDEMTHRNIVAAMALSGQTIVTAMVPSGGGEPIYANGVAGTENGLTLFSSAVQAATAMTREATAGYQATAVERTTDQAPVTVDGTIPLTSALLALTDLNSDLQALLTVLDLPAGSQQRETRNRQMIAAAGLTLPTLELEAEPGGGWHSVGTGVGVVRSARTRVRKGAGGASSVMLHTEVGSEAGHVLANGILAETIKGLTDGDRELIKTYYSSAAEVLSGRNRQTLVIAQELVWVPFQVVPDQFLLLPDSNRVVFHAAMPYPPEGGYRIRWQWTDGVTTIVTNDITGEYTYPQPLDYDVIVRLHPVGVNTVLAVDTVEVRTGTPMWRITSWDDLDGYYDLDDNLNSKDPFETIVDTAGTGLIGVVATPGGSEMRLWVRKSGLWSDADCCPPTFSAAHWVLPLGTKPESQANLGPYFASYRLVAWLGDDLGDGLWTASGIGPLRNYNVLNAGVQVGPEYATKLLATADGKELVGTFTVIGWFMDEDIGALEPDSERSFRFLFRATRLR